jgi:uncharacterized protein (TIGR02145 family)
MQYANKEGDQGLCQTGWHIPTDAEWTTLTAYLGGSPAAGGKMKSTGTIQDGDGLWTKPNVGGTNESGFTGHPGGKNLFPVGGFAAINYFGFFWSSTQGLPPADSDAWFRELWHGNSVCSRFGAIKTNGYSVRCLKDE